ncbi:MAG: hypothetical protein ABIK28_24035 [Planctomycetota bacterium]
MSRILIIFLLIHALLHSTLVAEDATLVAKDRSTPEPASGAMLLASPAAEKRVFGSITTQFAATSGYRGNMFDITMLTFIDEITGIDVNVDPAGQPVWVDLYWREGTCVGHDMSPEGWYLLGSGESTAAGYDMPTFIDLAGNGRTFDADMTYGFYVDITSYPTTGINYTVNLQKTYTNSEMRLTTHYGKGTPAFAGPTFYNRLWNGTVYYDFNLDPSLTCWPRTIMAKDGGQVEFDLYGDLSMAGRAYALLGTLSGTSPGTTLPGGLTLPLNWDFFTHLLLEMGMSGNPWTVDFLGQLDPCGQASALLTLPGGMEIYNDTDVHFAWCTYAPFDFVSQDMKLTLLGLMQPPSEYIFDDGTAEIGVGWALWGEAVWCHCFDAGAGDWITEVSSSFGCIQNTWGPPDGDPCWIYVWEDPNDDGFPGDAILVGEGSGLIANSNTSVFNHYMLDAPAWVEGKFFVACHCRQDLGVYAAPADQTTLAVEGTVWFMGGDFFDKNDLSTTSINDAKTFGHNGVWALRANDERYE